MVTMELASHECEMIVAALICKMQANNKAIDLITSKEAKYHLLNENECLYSLMERINKVRNDYNNP